MIACSHPAPIAQQPNRPRPIVKQPEKTTTIAPEVAALLKPDPDIDTPMSKEEIKATLANAQHQPSRSASADLPGTSTQTEWGKIEGDQKSKLDAYHQFLDGTTVYLGSDGMYHTRMCERVNEIFRDPTTGVGVRKFTGRAISLADAKASATSRHAECGAPSYDLR